MKTLAALRQDVLTRLGDLAQTVWTADEVELHLRNGYQQIATSLGVFWDVTYLENIPAGFSLTAAWERPFLADLVGSLDYGVANCTMEDERRALGDERLRVGPATHTSPFEVYDGYLTAAGASAAIPATADVPTTLTALDRVTWDKRGLDAMEARRLSRVDARYEITAGEVYGYIWQKDGIRTLRKVRVPAARADLAAVEGAWGALRAPGDLSGAAVTGTWGVPRRIPGQFPMGASGFGLPRRPYLEGKNVRVEHFRQGRPLDDVAGGELPDRYTVYLRDYALSHCYGRRGPGESPALAAHFDQRWLRGLARLQRRLQLVDREQVHVLGGDDVPLTTRPPRPQLPWPYGSVVR